MSPNIISGFIKSVLLSSDVILSKKQELFLSSRSLSMQ